MDKNRIFFCCYFRSSEAFFFSLVARDETINMYWCAFAIFCFAFSFEYCASTRHVIFPANDLLISIFVIRRARDETNDSWKKRHTVKTVSHDLWCNWTSPLKLRRFIHWPFGTQMQKNQKTKNKICERSNTFTFTRADFILLQAKKGKQLNGISRRQWKKDECKLHWKCYHFVPCYSSAKFDATFALRNVYLKKPQIWGHMSAMSRFLYTFEANYWWIYSTNSNIRSIRTIHIFDALVARFSSDFFRWMYEWRRCD